jgi:RNA-binding protein
MPLAEKQKRLLRQMAHPLKPVVILGNQGLTETLLAEIEQQLEHHELIKIRVNGEDREERRDLIDTLQHHCGAELVQQIGHIAVLYRAAQKPRLILPAR